MTTTAKDDLHAALHSGRTNTDVDHFQVQRIVKDRLAVTGARWSLTGAEAVLLLRAVITNGDFDAYWRFHLQREHQRTHTSRYQDQYDLAA
jgi:hypothetical protein